MNIDDSNVCLSTPTLVLYCGRCDQPLSQHPFLNEMWANYFALDYDEYDKVCARFPAYLDHEGELYAYATTGDPDFQSVEPTDFDYYSEPPLTTVIPVRDYSYNPGDLFTDKTREYTEWEDFHASSAAELSAWLVPSWTDVEPTICARILVDADPNEVRDSAIVTLADGTSHSMEFSLDNLATERKRDETYSEPVLDLETASVSVAPRNENGHGFTSQVLINPDATEGFQRKVFNYFIGRDERAHIGSFMLGYLSDGRPALMCSHPGCLDRATNSQRVFEFPTDSWPTPSRYAMERFIFQAIRHGNNHGPEWLTSRQDFTFIHAQNCDTSQHHIEYVHKNVLNYGKYEWRRVPIATNCNTDKPIFVVADLDPKDVKACYEVILKHRELCKAASCRCDHYESLLWDELYGSSLVLTH